jgi:ubiquitin carboxyl-terminal hydrolase 4/11/15
MSNTPFLIPNYVLKDLWKHEVNVDNPLGMQGAISHAFADLMHQLWDADRSNSYAVAPRQFKMTMSRFAPQFSGYAQHDSQELLGFLLDGLHEDLNRVRNKPYIELKDADHRPDHEVALEQWNQHKSRNDSIIVDLFQGQYRSKVQCLACNHISLKFDPYMVLTLPIPSLKHVPITLFAIPFPHYGDQEDSLHLDRKPAVKATIYVKNDACIADFMKIAVPSLFKRKGAKGILVEVFQKAVYRVYNDYDSIQQIQPNDEIYLYELPSTDLVRGYCTEILSLEVPTSANSEVIDHNQPKNSDSPSGNEVNDASKLPESTFRSFLSSKNPNSHPKDYFGLIPVFFTHGYKAFSSSTSASDSLGGLPPYPYSSTRNTLFGIPTLGFVPPRADLEQVMEAAILSIQPWTTFPWGKYRKSNPTISPDVMLKVSSSNGYGKEGLSKALTTPFSVLDITWDDKVYQLAFANSSQFHRSPNSIAEESESWSGSGRWSEIELVPTINAPLGTTNAKKEFTFDMCFDAFVEEETLGPNDPVYCSKCKKHQEARKKVDLWSTPQILVFAFKRFGQGGRFLREKLDAYVDFPHHLNFADRFLSALGKEDPTESDYELYAVINHYGGIGGGHCTYRWCHSTLRVCMPF